MMEKITDMELYVALKTVQQYCRSKRNCDNDCPMYNQQCDGCQFTLSTAENPASWDLKEPPTDWKVFDI